MLTTRNPLLNQILTTSENTLQTLKHKKTTKTYFSSCFPVRLCMQTVPGCVHIMVNLVIWLSPDPGWLVAERKHVFWISALLPTGGGGGDEGSQSWKSVSFRGYRVAHIIDNACMTLSIFKKKKKPRAKEGFSNWQNNYEKGMMNSIGARNVITTIICQRSFWMQTGLLVLGSVRWQTRAGMSIFGLVCYPKPWALRWAWEPAGKWLWIWGH